MKWSHKKGYIFGCGVVIIILFGMQAQLQQVYAPMHVQSL